MRTREGRMYDLYAETVKRHQYRVDMGYLKNGVCFYFPDRCVAHFLVAYAGKYRIFRPVGQTRNKSGHILVVSVLEDMKSGTAVLTPQAEAIISLAPSILSVTTPYSNTCFGIALYRQPISYGPLYYLPCLILFSLLTPPNGHNIDASRDFN